MAMHQQLKQDESPQAKKAKEFVRAQQTSCNEWARARGYSPQLVHMVINDQRKCLRGQSLQIAKELGMK
jgi:gp16 family phage-associated protein